jgi:hypothetical protein
MVRRVCFVHPWYCPRTPIPASRGPKKVPFKTTVARARSKIFNAFGGVKTATRPGPHNDSRLESCQGASLIICTFPWSANDTFTLDSDVGRSSTRSVTIGPSYNVDTRYVSRHNDAVSSRLTLVISTVTNHQSNDEGHSR